MSMQNNTAIEESRSENQAKAARKRFFISLNLVLILLLLTIFLNIRYGSRVYSLEQIISGLRRDDSISQGMEDILWKIRLPRCISVVILGGALGLSGFLMQSFFRNPIAGPYILGISSGSRLAVGLCMIVAMGKYQVRPSSFTMIFASFIGACLSMLLVLLISQVVSNSAVLVLSGVMISYISSAITDFLITFADDASIASLLQWSRGSFSAMTWEHIRVMTLPVLVAAFATFLLSKPLDAFRLGEVYARSAGVNVRLFQTLLVVLSSLLAASVTAFAGPVSFVGIAVPHIVKGLLNSSKPIHVIPICFLSGSVFCLISDLLSRTLVAPLELSLSSVTAALGAPVVLYVMISQARRKVSN